MRRYKFEALTEEEFESHRRFELNIPKEWKLYVQERDRWACRRCNDDTEVQLHHIVPRSTFRDHHPDNLIVLCSRCHRAIHDGKIWIYVDDNGNFFFGGSRADLFTNT